MLQISSPPNTVFPAALKLASGCAYPAVAGPNGEVIKHVAPCQTGAGNGSAASPWRTIQEAMTNLLPGQVAYVHDDPAIATDYLLTATMQTTKSGTGATARIRIMGAPDEAKPVIVRTGTTSTELAAPAR